MEAKFEITIDSCENNTWQGKVRAQEGSIYEFQSELQLLRIMTRYLHPKASLSDLSSSR